MDGGARVAARCRIWRFTTGNCAASPEMIQSKTSLRFARHATPSCIGNPIPRAEFCNDTQPTENVRTRSPKAKRQIWTLPRQGSKDSPEAREGRPREKGLFCAATKMDSQLLGPASVNHRGSQQRRSRGEASSGQSAGQPLLGCMTNRRNRAMGNTEACLVKVSRIAAYS